jgi:hypothetical protein
MDCGRRAIVGVGEGVGLKEGWEVGENERFEFVGGTVTKMNVGEKLG